MREKMALLKMDESFATRYLNEGFSGGEKKRAEILQMALLEPTLAILDETDSGLDIDALRVVSEGVNALARPGDGHAAHHPLPAAAQLHQAALRAHHDGRPDRRRAAARSWRHELEAKGYERLRARARRRPSSRELGQSARGRPHCTERDDQRPKEQHMVAHKPQVDIGDYKYGFRDEEDYVFKSEHGPERARSSRRSRR